MTVLPRAPAKQNRSEGGPNAERDSPYDASAAASGYANVTGLVSTFALAAVVLVFLIAATTSKTPTPSQNGDMGLATILFAVGFLGCLLGAFAFASLAGTRNSPALLTNSMVIASVVAVSLVAVLGGFEALAKAFLNTASPAFALICAAAAGLSPVFVWFPLFDIEREFPQDGPATGRQSSSDRRARPYERWAADIVSWRRISRFLPDKLTPGERGVIALLVELTAVGVVLGVAGLVIHFFHFFGRPHQWQFYALGSWGLAYTGLAIVGALLFAANPENRLTPTQSRVINGIQVGFMFAVLAVSP